MFDQKTQQPDQNQGSEQPLHQLTLNKGNERFIFRYRQGQEDALLDTLIDQVRSAQTSFDWFDAAVVSFKITQELINRARKQAE